MYPASNGAAERAVRTMKNLLRKASDPYDIKTAHRHGRLTAKNHGMAHRRSADSRGRLTANFEA